METNPKMRDPAELAREFVDLLVKDARQGQQQASVGDAELPADEDGPDAPPVRLRVATVAAAVKTAFAIAPIPTLLHELRHGAPVVFIATGNDDLLDELDYVASVCLLDRCLRLSASWLKSGAAVVPAERAAVIFRRDADGKRPADADQKALAALASGATIIGIASDPDSLLPSELSLAVEARLTLPDFSHDIVAAIAEALLGSRPSRVMDENLARRIALADFQIAMRRVRDPDAFIERLEDLARRRVPAGMNGPDLERLVGFGEAREIGLGVAADLKCYAAGKLGWSVMDRGLLLAGLSGTGKTLYAQALATTAGVPLVAGSLGIWQASRDGHLGHTLGAMRKSFLEAKQSAPAIWFIDELDSFGDRGLFRPDNRDYSTQVVNALLECLDGAETREGVFVVGATNNPDAIDPAIRRAGRLDRIVMLTLPDVASLEGIARHHLGGELAKEDLWPIAAAALGATPADMAGWIRRSFGVARRAGRPVVRQDILDAVRDGQPDFAPDVRRRIAYHEAGHVVACLAFRVGRVGEVAITKTGGHTAVAAEVTDYTVEALIAMIAQALAGRAAERIMFGEIRSGSGGSDRSDIAHATRLATAIEATFGLGVSGPLYLGEAHGIVGTPRFAPFAQTVRETLRRAEAAATHALVSNRAALDRIAKALVAETYLSSARVREIAGEIMSTPIEKADLRDGSAPQICCGEPS